MHLPESPRLPELRPWAALLALALASCAAPTAGQRPAPADSAARATPSPPGWRNDWARGAVFYEVFVRSFQDSDGDGKGDLKGLISRLDYLEELGVEGLWLMPVFESPSYHGYDVVDYEDINPDYGTNEDFAALVREAHARGIRIVLDFVINHTGRGHPWFIESSASPDSPRRDWYVWRADNPGWTQPWGGPHSTWHEKNGAYYYGVFWGGMPDLNLRNPEVRAEVKRLARLWLDRGADGFRLDAARHLIERGPGQLQNDSPETHAFWKELSSHVRSIAPEALLIGESWTDTPIIATYYGSTAEVRGGDELPMTFDFPLAEAILEGVDRGEATGIAAKLEEIQRTYPPGVLDGTFLTNHDQWRVATRLANNRGMLGSAAAVLLTLPGTPFLYYGEEIGMLNGPGRPDEYKRMPMPWDGSPTGGFTTGRPWSEMPPFHEVINVEARLRDPGALLHRYRGLVKLRRDSRALREGGLRLLTPTTGRTPVLAFVRETPDERVLVIHNLGSSATESGPFAVPATELVPMRVDPGVTATRSDGGGWRISLAGHATGVWRLR